MGGSTGFLLHGPYVINKSQERLNLQFVVVITRDSYAALKAASQTIEDTFRKRDQNLTISLGGATFTYTNGNEFLNSTSEVVKTGDIESDRGFLARLHAWHIG